MPFTATEYRRCQSHPSYIQPGDTDNCCTQSRVILYDLVSIYHSFPPVECHKRYQQYTQPPASLCRPTIVKYEPPAFSLEAPTQMLMQDEQNQVLQNHMVAANAVFNKVAVFEQLIWKEPHNAMYYEEVQRIQKNQHIHVAIKLQHILETDDKF